MTTNVEVWWWESFIRILVSYANHHVIHSNNGTSNIQIRTSFTTLAAEESYHKFVSQTCALLVNSRIVGVHNEQLF